MKYVITLRSRDGLEQVGVTREEAIKKVTTVLSAQKEIIILEGIGTRVVEVDISEVETTARLGRELMNIVTILQVMPPLLVSTPNGARKTQGLSPKPQ